MRNIGLKIFGVTMLVIFSKDLQAKEWRGITPLKSTKADVERLLGKENEWKRYQFENERAHIFYSTERCGMKGATEVTEKCRCLIPDGTVVSINVTVEESRRFSSLKRDKREFQKEFILSGMYEYSDLTEGVRYTVDERSDEIVQIVYLPSAKDCDDLVTHSKKIPANEQPGLLTRPSSQEDVERLLGKSKAGAAPNEWQGLLPLHSSREDVERLLGKPQAVFESIVIYRQPRMSVWIKYIDQVCDANKYAWNVPAGTIERIQVSPMTPLLLTDLKFDLSAFEKIVSVHPKGVFNYLNEWDGINVSARLYGEREEVSMITYEAAGRDENLRCTNRRKHNTSIPVQD